MIKKTYPIGMTTKLFIKLKHARANTYVYTYIN